MKLNINLTLAGTIELPDFLPLPGPAPAPAPDGSVDFGGSHWSFGNPVPGGKQTLRDGQPVSGGGVAYAIDGATGFAQQVPTSRDLLGNCRFCPIA